VINKPLKVATEPFENSSSLTASPLQRMNNYLNFGLINTASAIRVSLAIVTIEKKFLSSFKLIDNI